MPNINTSMRAGQSASNPVPCTRRGHAAAGGGRALAIILVILAAITANGRGSRVGGGDRVRKTILRSGVPAFPSSPSFAVYRLLGNDMWPLQGIGQLRRNTAFAVKNEVAAPANVSVFWVINRIVNATERELLISELKHLGVGDEQILYVHPPLAGMQCLNSTKDKTLFAQGLNVARNAAVAHARSMGFDWALPLDGNQFLPSDFYVNIHSALKAAESDGRVALLVPMLRVLEEQTASTHNASTDSAALAVLQINRENSSEYLVSEPQLALHTRDALDHGFEFNPNRGYGKRNKAALIDKLCDWKNRGENKVAHCCELVTIAMQQRRASSNYSGGELNLAMGIANAFRALDRSKAPAAPQTGPETEEGYILTHTPHTHTHTHTHTHVADAGAVRRAEAKEGLRLAPLATVRGSSKLKKLGPPFEEAFLISAACSAMILLAGLIVVAHRSNRSFVLASAVLALMCAGAAAVTVFRFQFQNSDLQVYMYTHTHTHTHTHIFVCVSIYIYIYIHYIRMYPTSY
jgi:hypothetical protein